MGLEQRRGFIFGPATRLPDEVQDLLGIRFVYDLPDGPIRESVEGYLAMPESQRGPNSMARQILVQAVSRERGQVRRQRRPFDAILDAPSDTPLDLGASIELVAPAVLSGYGPDSQGTSDPLGNSEPPGESASLGGGDLLEGSDPLGGSDPLEGPDPREPTDPPAHESSRATRDPERRASEHGAAGGDQGESVANRPHTRFEFGDPVAISMDPALERATPAHAFGDYRLRDAREDFKVTPAGWTTGFGELDRCGMRFVPGNLYMVEGPIGAGKTALMLEILRRHAELVTRPERRLAPAVFVPGGESPAEVYARLLFHEASTRAPEPEQPEGLSREVVRRWLRGGEALTERHGRLLDAASTRIDQLIAEGLITIANPAHSTVHGDDLVAWLDAATAESECAHSLVLIDDLHTWMKPPGPRSGSRRDRTVELVACLRAIARGGRRGPEFATAIVFSLVTELNGHPGTISMVDPGISAAEVRGLMRVARSAEKGTCSVTLRKNGSGPSEVTFPFDLAFPSADRHRNPSAIVPPRST